MKKILAVIACICLLFSISSMTIPTTAAEECSAAISQNIQADTAEESAFRAETEPSITETSETSQPDAAEGGSPESRSSNGFPWQTVISALALCVSILSFFLTFINMKRTQWASAMDFFNRFDSFEVRSSRRRVYEAAKKGKASGKNIKDLIEEEKQKEGTCKLEDDVCHTISMYDATIRMIRMRLLPINLLEGPALWTAVNFFILIEPYIEKRRSTDNPHYGNYFVVYLLDKKVRKKIISLKTSLAPYAQTTANSLIKEYEIIFNNWTTTGKLELSADAPTDSASEAGTEREKHVKTDECSG